MPVLVHDGAVHIESNDIIQHLEKTFPSPKLIPAGYENEVAALLRHEDDLHLDLRTSSFRFVFNPPGPPKPAAMLRKLCGKRHRHACRARETAKKTSRSSSGSAPQRKASPTSAAKASAQKFRVEFDALDKRLAGAPYLMGEALSVLDIAWFIYAHRLSLGGYPLARLHPHVHAWKEKLGARPEFAKEIAMPPEAKPASRRRIARTRLRADLEAVAGF